jgi:hypothetical protein
VVSGGKVKKIASNQSCGALYTLKVIRPERSLVFQMARRGLFDAHAGHIGLRSLAFCSSSFAISGLLGFVYFWTLCCANGVMGEFSFPWTNLSHSFRGLYAERIEAV